MYSSIARIWLRGTLMLVAAAMLAGLAVVLPPSVHASAAEPTRETRALWVLRASLTSPESIATMVQTARSSGFNTLLVQVRARGDAYFSSTLEPRADDLRRQPASFDPLAAVLSAAHAVDLKVQAWINVNFISSAAELPLASTHLVLRHPEWLMVPRDLVQDLARVDETSPGYVGKIARWTRTQSTGPASIEGLYASPIVPEATDHLTNVVRDLVSRYDVDGVHLDYARYPSERFDYSRFAIREFRNAIRQRLSPAARRDADARDVDDPVAYPDAFPDEWKAFRISRMTALVSRLHDTIKSARPSAMVTVATAPDPQEARDHRLQDWSAWIQTGLVDFVCPMAYTTDPARFAEQIAAARSIAGPSAIWAGIGAYRLPPAQTIENIQAARRLGAGGVAVFSYDSLIDPRQSVPDYFAVLGRSAFATPAPPSGTR